MREIEMTGKTVELAVQAACEALGVDRDDINVSYEVLDFPVKKLFKTIPARVKVTVDEPETAAAPAAKTPAAPAAGTPAAAAAETPAPAAEPAAPEKQAEPEAAAQPAAEPAAEAQPAEEVPLDIAADARLQAAVDYLKPICEQMGASGLEFSAVKKGEATILRLKGDHVGVLIGRRGETMESLSYLTSLVINRMEGSYVKLGLDVAGYRGKREDDLEALARRMGAKVARTGRSWAMDPMNPYERRIIHSTISGMEGVRSESKGEGADRRVVIYSTDPQAATAFERESGRRRVGHGRDNGRGGRNAGRGGRGFRDSGRGNGRRDSGRGGRGSGRGGRGGKGGSYVPGRDFASAPRDPEAQPHAPARTSRIHDDAGEDFAFGKIEL